MNHLKWILPVGAILLISVIFFGMYISFNNKEISLAEQVTAQDKVCKSYFDKMWKVIQQEAEVANEYKEAFKEIYPSLMAGRYGKDGNNSLMSWIQEHNPNFDASLYKKLMTSIEAQRQGFFREQELLIDLDRQHKTLRKVIPASWFIGSRPDIKINIITSDKTEAVYATGKDNDTVLFKK